MKVGDLIDWYGWIGIAIKKHHFHEDKFLIYFAHNQREVWRWECQLEGLIWK